MSAPTDHPLYGQLVHGNWRWEDLYEAFETVADKQDWKRPIDAIVYDVDEVSKTIAAVQFFAGCTPSVTKIAPNQYRLQALGYYMAVGP